MDYNVLGSFLIMSAVMTTGNNDAIKASYKASYKQTGLDAQVKVLEKKIIPKHWKIYGGWIISGFKIATEHKITFEFTF